MLSTTSPGCNRSDREIERGTRQSRPRSDHLPAQPLAQSEVALQQAGASLEQAKVNAGLVHLTQERDWPLGEKHAISQQNVDEVVQAYHARVADVAAEANITAAQANDTANRANVARLEQMRVL